MREGDTQVSSKARNHLIPLPTNQRTQYQTQHPGEKRCQPEQTNGPGQRAHNEHLRGGWETQDGRSQIVLDEKLLEVVNVLLKKVAIQPEDRLIVFHHILT